jgi:hypothetical protein
MEMPRPRKRKSLNFESIIQYGQNPKGFTGQTANGTAKSGNCPGWNVDYNYDYPEAPAEGLRKNGNFSDG